MVYENKSGKNKTKPSNRKVGFRKNTKAFSFNHKTVDTLAKAC